MVLQFGDLSFLDASPNTNLNYIIKKVMKFKSMKKRSTMKEANKSVNMLCPAEGDAALNTPRSCTASSAGTV